MSSLAQQALENARARVVGQPVRTKVAPAKSTSNHVEKKEQAAQSEPAHSLDVIAEGLVNRVMFLEGRAHAVDLAKSVSHMDGAAIVAVLQRSAVGRPSSYVLGVTSIIDLLKEADHANEA